MRSGVCHGEDIFFGGYRCSSTRIFGVDIYQARIRIFLVISNSLFFLKDFLVEV